VIILEIKNKIYRFGVIENNRRLIYGVAKKKTIEDTKAKTPHPLQA